MPEIRIAALDLDGTLLSRENTVTPATRQAIADAVARGVVVLPATGRALANLPPLVAQLPGVRYAITSNGAAVWDLGTDPLGAVYSRYSDAETRQTSEPACLVRRLFPVEKAREVFGLYQEFEGSLSVFSDGRVIRDRLAQERMGHHLRRLLSLSTEAKQPNDGRFHIVRDTAEWMSRHAHEIEKFCMFFENAPRRPCHGSMRWKAWKWCRAPRTTLRSRPKEWTRAAPCWPWPTGWASPMNAHWPWATATMTAPCWKRQAWPL